MNHFIILCYLRKRVHNLFNFLIFLKSLKPFLKINYVLVLYLVIKKNILYESLYHIMLLKETST